jgi:hypothetical protein
MPLRVPSFGGDLGEAKASTNYPPVITEINEAGVSCTSSSMLITISIFQCIIINRQSMKCCFRHQAKFIYRQLPDLASSRPPPVEETICTQPLLFEETVCIQLLCEVGIVHSVPLHRRG